MAKRNDEHKETRFCPFKKAVSVEYNSMTGRKEMHERFEERAGERCMAYHQEIISGKVLTLGCLRLQPKLADNPLPIFVAKKTD